MVTVPRGATAASVPAYRSRSAVDADDGSVVGAGIEEEPLGAAVGVPDRGGVGAGVLHAASSSAANATPAQTDDLMRSAWRSTLEPR